MASVTVAGTAGELDYLKQKSFKTQRAHSEAMQRSETGLKGALFSALGSNVSSYLGGQYVLKEMESYEEINSRVRQRVQIAQETNQQLVDIATRLRGELALKLGEMNPTGMAFQQSASGDLDRVVRALNIQLDGEYLFAGGKTDTVPVDSTLLTAGNIADTGYYQGDQTIRTVFIDTDTTINYGFKADESGYEKLMRGLKIIIGNGNDKDAWKDAYNLVTESVNELGDLGARMGTSMGSLMLADAARIETRDTLQNAVRETEATDMADALTQATMFKTQTEINFTIIATLIKAKEQLLSRMT